MYRLRGTVTGIDLSQEQLLDDAFSVPKPIAPGRQHVVRHLKRRDNAGADHVCAKSSIANLPREEPEDMTKVPLI